MPPKKKVKEDTKSELEQELDAVKERISTIPVTAEFRQAKKFLIMYARELESINGSQKK